ncbi:MAG: hypothetical protein PHS47_03995 [Methanocellales archaeon]|nr:hypothetical protein [Methanocellales archaeon]MDD3421444.1 hypothetical protein [Methanocellales archaeon]MDD4898723.1 hypothetical protein [Methanocellales archaeon]MDD5446901.1 hypothetical protein [Methanocellales archaeon]
MNCKIGLVLILILSVLTVTFSGCVEEEPVVPLQPIAPRVEAAPTPTPAPKPTPALTEIPIPTRTQPQEVSQSEQIKFSGEGAFITSQFQLESGTSIFRIKNGGKSNFTVLLVNAKHVEWCGCYESITDVPVDTVGPFDGVKTVEILEPGDYILDIEAEGPWSILIEQP